MYRQDSESLDMYRICGRCFSADSALDHDRMYRFSDGFADTVSDRMDTVSHGGDRSRGCEAAAGGWLSERRQRRFLLYLFIFPVCSRNLARQIAESQTIQKQSDVMFSIFSKHIFAEEDGIVSGEA